MIVSKLKVYVMKINFVKKKLETVIKNFRKNFTPYKNRIFGITKNYRFGFGFGFGLDH